MESEGILLIQYIDNAVEIKNLKVCDNMNKIRETFRGHSNVLNARTVWLTKEVENLNRSNMCLWTVIFFMLVERICAYYF